MTPLSSCHSVLILDSDVAFSQSLAQYLRGRGLTAHTADRVEAMYTVLATHSVDLVVLDALLPGNDGLALLQELRSRLRISVILLKQGCDTFDRVIGLEAGADDYLGKPFLPQELAARIQSVLRRVHGGQPPSPDGAGVVHFDEWQLHCAARHLITPAGATIPLSTAEFRLLCRFLSMPRRICNRGQLMEGPYGCSLEAHERSIDLAVSRLRRKLGDDPREPCLIKTVRGVGYLFDARHVEGRIPWPV